MWGLGGRIAVVRAAAQRWATLTAFGMLPMLAGCITADQPDLAIRIPGFYRAAPKVSLGAPPALDWWRGFGSPELTSLIEEAHTANFDIAAAVARIVEADAQAKVVGAALLPA